MISKRLCIAIAALIFLISTTYLAISKEQETVATSCIAGVMTLLSTYLWAETKRPTGR